MFGATEAGGEYGGGIIWELTSGGTYKDLHNFGGPITYANGTTFTLLTYNNGPSAVAINITAAYGGSAKTTPITIDP